MVGRIASGLFFALSLAAVLAATLMPASGKAPPAGGLGFLERGLYLADALRNVLLFMPLGAALGLLLRSPILVVLLAAALSISLELAQLLVPGRYATLEDLLMNAVGALLGASIALTAPFWGRPRPWLARLLAVAWAGGVVALLWLTASFSEPWLPRTQYFGGHTLALGHLEQYEGELLSARLGDQPLRQGKLADSEAIRDLLREGAPITLRATAGPPPQGLAPIFTIHDDGHRDILLIGVQGEDLVVFERVRGRALRFEQPVVHVPGWLAGVPVGEPLALTVQHNERGYCITLNGEERCGLGASVGSGWSFFFLPGVVPGSLRALINATWLLLLFAPLGYWHRSVGLSVAVLVPLAALLLGLPFATPLVDTPWLELAGAAAGVALGMLLRPRPPSVRV